MSIEVFVRCDRCGERLPVTGPHGEARRCAAEAGWRAGGASSGSTGSRRQDYCPDCARWAAVAGVQLASFAIRAKGE